MNTDEAEKRLREGIVVTREDIARAKAWLISEGGGRTDHLVESWLGLQTATVPITSKVDLMSPESGDQIARYARAFSVRLAFHQAQWELIASAEMFPAESPSTWEPSLEYNCSGISGDLNLKGLGCSYPPTIVRPPLASAMSADPDIFPLGISCSALHRGIREAIEQSLLCFRRGLYMPATVMLAAAAEATWTKCGVAVAKKLANAKLEGVVNDLFVSISKKVTEIQRALQVPEGKVMLKSAGRSSADVDNAELWTTNPRERRNALHWGKAKSFVADHSETASLLMGATLHI